MLLWHTMHAGKSVFTKREIFLKELMKHRMNALKGKQVSFLF